MSAQTRHGEWDPTQPFQELPPLPPRQDVETVTVLRKTIAARAALAAMDQAAQRLPNPEILLSTLTVLEAQASSEIENVVTTTDELFRHLEAQEGASPDVKEALRYRTGLFAGLRFVQNRGLITRTTAEEICTQLSGREVSLRRTPGTVIANPRTGQAVYTPPTGYETLDRKMAEWETYVNSPQLHDPLVRMSLAHYQFEAIHPFDDGNGRTGRILNILQTINDGVLSSPVLYLSRYIIAHKNDYYRLLRRVTSDGDFISWVEYMLEAVRATAESTLELIDRLQDIERELKEAASSALPGGGNLALVETLMLQPYTRITTVEHRCSVSRPTARKWLTALASAGILRRLDVGRNVLYLNDRYLRVLAEA
ncbi:Fic family protein [Garicola koreensis]|uniref:Fic family protein n=1 Tax=Garicola koreensis TaxID=1262554 RepID=A0A7W5TRX1_9MICC|nr:Fic/DOC family N-terminal domain-containing protein [Garicola koreensis]MBB3668065.1 Fic family protein [Garicola koreensis]